MHSSESAMNHVLYDWSASKTIKPAIAVDKLENYGIQDASLRWFQKLDALFRLIYISNVNNIVECSKCCTAKMLADDILDDLHCR